MAARRADNPRSTATSISNPARFAIAFSGGLDSTVLLHAMARLVGGERLLAVHVHHGLQPVADAWPRHCAGVASAMGVSIRQVAAAGEPAAGDSIEQWARAQRYRGIAQALAGEPVTCLLTAHHRDDQAETVLLRMARGCGLDGLAAIRPKLHLDGLRIERPLLDLPRSALLEHARRYGLEWVEDPSNQDPRHPRNAIRHQVLPALEAAVPGAGRALATGVALWREAGALLREVAIDDLARIRESARIAELTQPGREDPVPALNRSRLLELSDARRDAVLRLWLEGLEVPPPDRRRHAQIVQQLVLRPGSGGQVQHEDWLLVRHAQRIVALPRARHLARWLDGLKHWEGMVLDCARVPGIPAAPLELPMELGRLWCAGPADPLPAGCGLAACDLVGCDSTGGHQPGIRLVPGDRGGLRFRPAANRPSRTLKHLYQELGLPGWLRPAVPLLLRQGDSSGDPPGDPPGDAVFCGAFGHNRNVASIDGAPWLPALRWQPSALMSGTLARLWGRAWSPPV